MNRILVFDPDASLVERLKQTLEQNHHWVVSTNDSVQARALIQKQLFHLCLWPVEKIADAEGIFSLKTLRPEMAVVVMSPAADPALIVACMRAGASHFWLKDHAVETFSATICETLSRVVREEGSVDFEFPLPQFVGRHPSIIEIFRVILNLRNSDSNILITGESGSGKEVVARAIHDLSPRKRHPWVAINCSAIPASLLESELFGHVKGSFTGATHNRMGRFQMAGAGTLFLDEISELPFDLQSKLLRAIQHRVYEPVGSGHSLTLDARIIAATNQDLEAQVAEKKFRQDLFYRLNVIPIYIPPLRARKTDIPLLARFFLEKFNRLNNKGIPGITEEAMLCLTQYHWPGNIRELENLLERVVVLKQNNSVIEQKDFPTGYFQNVRLDRFVANVALPDEGLDFNRAVHEFESELILQALQRTAGNKNQAATLLNLNRTTLVEKLKRKGLRVIS